MISPRIKPSAFFPEEAPDDLFLLCRRKAKLGGYVQRYVFTPPGSATPQRLPRTQPEARAGRSSAATCANLLKIEPALWTFTAHADVPPTNNSAAQALRPVVLKRKISGPTRSRRGANFIARGFSVAETCRRQGRDLLDYLHRSMCAWIDKTEAPALLRPALASG